MGSDFHETKNRAERTLGEMYEHYFELKREQEEYLEIGEKEQAESMQERIDDLDAEIQFEESMFRQAFY